MTTTSVDCPICAGASTRQFEVSDYWVRQCQACTHQFAELSLEDCHVDRVYGDDYFSGGGAGYSNYLSEERLLVARGRWYARRLSRYCQPGSVLDVGAAAGFTLQGFSQAGWECFGIEPNARMAEYARQHFGLGVEAGSLETWASTRSFDLVTMLQVLPHFVDPREALLKARNLLRLDGHLLIETWNRRSWTARLSGKAWHEYSPPSVLHWFSKLGLIQWLANSGFRLVASGRPSKWVEAGHAKSILRHKAATSLSGRLLLGVSQIVPNRVAIPYPAEDLFWALFQRLE